MSRTYIIYMITSLDPKIDYCYIGSTQNFTKRKIKHKSMCNNASNSITNTKLYNTMRENGGWDNFSMTRIEEYKCDTPIQARKREQFWINNIEEKKMNSYDAFIDDPNPTLTQKEKHRKIIAEQIAEQIVDFYFKNQELMSKKEQVSFLKNLDE